MRKHIWMFIVIALAALAGMANNAGAATLETPLFTPVNFWVSPPTISTKMNFFIDFDLYMASTTANMQPNATSLRIVSCNGAGLLLNGRTRHLTGGETLVIGHGGPGAVTALQWTRPMGAPPAAQAVKLHLSFISTRPDSFCVDIVDASELAGPRSTRIELSMK